MNTATRSGLVVDALLNAAPAADVLPEEPIPEADGCRGSAATRRHGVACVGGGARKMTMLLDLAGASCHRAGQRVVIAVPTLAELMAAGRAIYRV